MQLEIFQRNYLISEVMEKFDRSREEAIQTIKELEALLLHEDETIIYDLQYKIFINDNPEYTRALVQFLFESFVYLYETAKSDEEKKVLQIGNRKVFDFLFIERCSYAKQIEKQSITAQNILKNVSDQLNSLLQTQERMIANLSHDMRTSLNAIMGYLNILDDNKSLHGEEKFYLQKAMSGAVSLQSLVKDILDLTKLNSGQLEIKKEFFDIDEMLIECIDHIPSIMREEQNINFQYHSKFMPYRIYGDKMHIMEILINFLTNAFKYTKTGFIDFSMDYTIDADKITVVFSVSDSGIGMTKEQVDDVFSPYSRYKTDEKGLGLGMYITKHLSEKLGGTLDVQSTYKEGSTFSFTYTSKYSPKKLSLKGKHFCFYVEEKRMNEYVKEKMHFLETSGVKIKYYNKESELINYLLSTQEDVPDIISIMAEPNSYTKFDALIYYLKNNHFFDNTLFIAENMHEYISLKYFDNLYEYCAPLSHYETLLNDVNDDVDKVEKLDISVLVIDDMETNLEIFKLFIQKEYPHAKIDLAGGGYEALGMCKVKTYDVVFLDLKMPGMSGFEVIQKLKKHGSFLMPIYAFTADVYKSTYEKTEEYGFAGVLEKPLNPEKLYTILNKIQKIKKS